MKNIVLIGMPGCGKSTIGRLLSQMLDMKYIDIDDYIEQKEQKSIKDLFAESEDCFRDAETRSIKELSKMNSSVLAAGGGIIKRKENIDSLRKSSVVVFINRPVENIIKDIDYETRPLLADGKKRIHDLYNERIYLYKSYSDIEVYNIGTLNETVKNVVNMVEKFNKKYEISY